MKLLYSSTSPYARKVLLLAQSLNMPLTSVPTNPLEDEEAFLKANPLGKVPVLVLENGETLFDSPVILEWLLEQAGAERSGAAYFEGLQIMAVTDGILDAALSLVMEARRPEAERSSYWQDRWYRAIGRSLDHLEERYVDTLTGWSAPTIAAACTLDYLLFRLPEIDWQGAFPKLSAWFDGVAARDDFRATDPRL